ncbi:MAG: flagellar hook-associated protein FlgK [Alphaproteobacteria bacterium]|uniref:Flagellar hook-associated protein 1 n=1 Tax=Candidatus Nitrobium versatile TaxID=2884831 RepID=A0A953J2R7_9BACT|nr:flagellar hook-associated protein FlgK [Candidatus Nitrobium versatile]
MSVFGLFDIGKTAMMTARKALDTTAHNIANAATPGYTRQQVVLETIPSGTVVTKGVSGRGVRVNEVKRMYDSFVSLQLRNEKSSFSYWETADKNSAKVESIFNDTNDTGISAAITDFFAAWQEVAQYPEAYAQRASLLQNAQNLTVRINRAYISLEEERKEIYSSSQKLVDEVNILTSQIATLNEKVASSPGSLDLRDQRDSLLERLNEIVKVTTFTDSSDKYYIVLGGTALVDGGKVNSVSVQTDTGDAMRFYVGLASGNVEVTADIRSGGNGELGANADAREGHLLETMQQLNTFAFHLAESINFYNRQGYGLDGTTWNNFFETLYLTSDPAGGGTISSVDVTDLDLITYNKKYKVNYIDAATYASLSLTPDEALGNQADYRQEGTSGIYWRVRESSDGGSTWSTIDPSEMTVTPYTSTTPDYRTLEFNGIRISLQGDQGVLSGNGSEEFLIETRANAAREIKVEITDYKKIAAAQDTFLIDGSNDTFTFNEGNGNKTVVLSHGSYSGDELAQLMKEALEDADESLSSTYSVSFDPILKKFTFINGTANTNQIALSSALPGVEAAFGFGAGVLGALNAGVQATSTIPVSTPFVIDATNDTFAFSEDGGATTTTVTLSHGTYTGEELAAYLKQLMEDADSTTPYTYAVSYNSQSNQFTFTNGNPTVTLSWGSASLRETFGFDESITMASGETFVSDNAVSSKAVNGLPGDNRNARYIADLINLSIIEGQNPLDYYRAIVANVGVEAYGAKMSLKAQNTIVEELERRREEISGISLDEEAANLLKWQKSYEAAAKMITIADEMLSTLMEMTGR